MHKGETRHRRCVQPCAQLLCRAWSLPRVLGGGWLAPCCQRHECFFVMPHARFVAARHRVVWYPAHPEGVARVPLPAAQISLLILPVFVAGTFFSQRAVVLYIVDSRAAVQVAVARAFRLVE